MPNLLYRRLTQIVAALICLSQFSQANDGYIDGVVGSPTIAKGEHRQIRMESEKVVLTLKAQKTGWRYETDARFVFSNDSSRPVTVRMGFPEGSSIQEDKYLAKNTFLRFVTMVNGQVVKARRTVVQNPDATQVRWIKTVSFAPHERKNVRVMALSNVGIELGDGAYVAKMAYDFTGKNWKGLVSRSDLEVRFPKDGLWAVRAEKVDEEGKEREYGKPARVYWRPSVTIVNGVGVLRKTWRNWQAQCAVSFEIQRVVPYWMSEPPEYDDPKRLENTVTFRVGRKPKEETDVDAGAFNGFVRDGIAFVAWRHLVERAKSIDKKVKTGDTWNSATSTATLRRGLTTISLVAEDKKLTVQNAELPAHTVTMPAASRWLQVGKEESLFVPLAATAQALGLKVKVEAAQRRFRIEK